MPFIRYQHVEKLGSVETEGLISITEPCYVFPKIDGTNGSIWQEADGSIHFGSRNREVSLDNDNQGFMESLHNNAAIKSFFADHPGMRLYGEWLVPHTLKTYSDDAWRQFYVFDVCFQDDDGDLAYVPYDTYKTWLDEHGIEYVPCMAVVERGTLEQFNHIAASNGYLMKEGEVGEGIVIKRYGFKNKYGRTVWAKIVRNDFKARHLKEMGPQEFKATKMVEESIVATFLTTGMIEKVYANIVNENDGWSSKMIPRLLHTCYYDLIREECWNFVKANKNPTIDFGALQKFAYATVKRVKPELF